MIDYWAQPIRYVICMSPDALYNNTFYTWHHYSGFHCYDRQVVGDDETNTCYPKRVEDAVR